MFLIYVVYLTKNGWSNPSSWFNWFKASPDAPAPKINVAGSPGVNAIMKNMMNVTPSNIGISISSLFRMNLYITSLLFNATGDSQIVIALAESVSNKELIY
jgi:hypothetical protein